MKSLKQKISKILAIILISILFVIAMLTFYVIIQSKANPDRIPSIFGYKPFIVLSGSMETEIYKGDLVIVKEIEPNILKQNDIIAFREKEKYVVTHRIIDMISEDGQTKFITKGDNNNEKDSGSVSFEDVEGKYVCKIKGLGNIVLVMQKPLTLIVILGVIVIIGILWLTLDSNKLTREERKELEKLRKERNK